MINEGEFPKEADVIKEAESVLREARKSSMKEESGEKQPEKIRLDPNVNPGVILYPAADQIKTRLDQFHDLSRGIDRHNLKSTAFRIGLLEKLKIGVNPSIAIDRESKARADGFRDGQLFALETYLRALGQGNILNNIKYDPVANIAIAPAELSADFGTSNVAELLDEYGYELRFAIFTGTTHTESLLDSVLNPISKIKQIKRQSVSELREWTKGRVLGKLAMSRDVLEDLGQTSQLVKIEKNVEKEIATDPEKFKENMNKRRDLRAKKAFDNLRNAVEDMKD